MTPTKLLCSTCGWTAPAPAAPTRFGSAIGRGVVAAGHQLSATLAGDNRHHVVDVEPPPLTVTLELDTTEFDRGMRKALGDLEDIRWKNRLRGERTAARRWWGDYITEAYARYGWEWPGPVPGTAWARSTGTRLTSVTPKDPSAPTVAELEAGTDISGYLA